jgi:hypothetical protein
VKLEIESKGGLSGSDGTRQILALLTTLQHSQIRIEDVGALVWTGSMDQDLAMNGRSACHYDDKHRYNGKNR